MNISITSVNSFNEKFSIKKILFDLQFDFNKVYCITFDKIPTKQSLRDFYSFLDNNCSLEFRDRIIIFRDDANTFVKTINENLNNERKIMKFREIGGIFINDTKVYDTAFKIYSRLNDNRLITTISTTKIHDEELYKKRVSNPYFWTTEDTIKSPSTYINFSNIQF